MKQQGYTLIELFITLAILGILSGYALPSFFHLRQSQLMENDRNRLTSSLHFARNHAVFYQTYVIICPSLTGNKCDNQSNWHQGWIVFTDKNKNKSLDVEDKLLLYENPMTNDITALSSIHRKKIRYNTMGFSPGTNLSINFCDVRGSDHAIAIILSNSGRIKQSLPISNNVCS